MRSIIHALRPYRLVVAVVLVALGYLASVAVQDPPDAAAYALWIDVECSDKSAREGGTFRLHIVTEQPPHLGASTIKVYWTTIEGTADETDYLPLKHEGQASNRFQSNQARMGRTFYTRNDQYSEFTEHFYVKAVNASSDSRAAGQGRCKIDIYDHDGPGAAETWIASEPADGWYGRGDTIRVNQKFTEPVAVQGGQVNVGLLFGNGSEVEHRSAHYVSGTGTDTLTFEYTVSGDDLDADGIEVQPSDYDGTGSIVTLESRSPVNAKYRGVPVDDSHKVNGKTRVEDISVISSPDDGDTYRKDEELEVQMRFDRPVEVDGWVYIVLRIGEGEGSWAAARYDRGSGTDTLVFKQSVRAHDLDTDGFRVVNGYIGPEGQRYGFGGGGSITDQADGFTVSPYYTGMIDPSGHRVDGRPYVTGVAVTSDPPNGTHYRTKERMMISLTFDRAVSVQPKPAIKVQLGDRPVLAEYHDGSFSDTLVFSYRVREGDVAESGISIPAQEAFSGTGAIREAGEDRSVDGRIPALDPQPDQTVQGLRPRVLASAIVSTPASSPHYRPGESIEIALEFNEPVTVLGVPYVRIHIDETGRTRRDAKYVSGSGTNVLVFSYIVQETDLDRNGIAMLPGENEGFTGNVRVYQAGTENTVAGYVPGFTDDPQHRVAGRVHVESVDVTSDPGDDGVYVMGDTIELSVTFDDDVTVTGTPLLSLDLGGTARTAAFREARDAAGSTSTANTGEVLVFDHTVQAGDEATGGIAVVQDAIDLNGGSIVGPSGNQPELGNSGRTFADHRVIEVAPVLEGARTSRDGSQVILTFSESVRVDPALQTLSTFAGVDVGVYLRALIDVFIDGRRAHTHGAVVSGEELTLDMDTPTVQGQVVEAAYDDVFARDVPGLIVDHADNPLEHFSNQMVTNNSTVPADADANWPVISAYSVTIAEGGTGSYTVALGVEPSGDVAVSLSIMPDSHLTASAQQLTFTPSNWSTAQTVTLTAGTDADGRNFWQEIVHTADVHGFVAGHLKVLIED